MTLDTSTTKTVNAAFSKSVSCTSIERNSTRQPICAPDWASGSALSPSDEDALPAEVFRFFFFGDLEMRGGGFQRRVCQLVDCRFSKWSVSASSSMVIRSS